MWRVIAWVVPGVIVLAFSLAGIVVYYSWEADKQSPISRVIAVREVGIKLPEGAGDLEFHREESFNEFVYIRFSVPAAELDRFFAENPELPSADQPEKRPDVLNEMRQLGTELGWWRPGGIPDARAARRSRMIELGGSDWTRQWLVNWRKQEDRMWVHLLRIEQPGDVRFEEDQASKKDAGAEEPALAEPGG